MSRSRRSAPAVFHSEAIRLLFQTDEEVAKRARETEADTEEGRGSKRVRATEERSPFRTEQPSAQVERATHQEPERERSLPPDEQFPLVEERQSTPVALEKSPQGPGGHEGTEPYELLREHGIVVCTECCTGIEPTEITSHLHGKRHKKPRKIAEDIASIVNEWPFKRSVEEVVWPKQPVPAMRLLGKPVDAFRCDLTPDCVYICRSQRLMKMHWRNVHDYKVWGKGGGLTAAQLAENRKKWGPFKHVKAQQFFRTRYTRYFEVYEEPPSPSEARQRVEVLESLMSEGEDETMQDEWEAREEPVDPAVARELELEQEAMQRLATEQHRNRANYEEMKDVLRRQLARWSRECPVCVVAGRDSRHGPTTADCPLANREDIEYVESQAKFISDHPTVKSCKFCRMPMEVCIARVTGKDRCDESSSQQILRILAGLLSVKGLRLSLFVFCESNRVGTPWLAEPVAMFGRSVSQIMREIYIWGKDVEQRVEATQAILQVPTVPPETGQRERLVVYLQFGLSQRCKCGDHRVSECVDDFDVTAEKIQKLGRKVKFYAKGICSRSGMPMELCRCDVECKYDGLSGLDAIYAALQRNRAEKRKWKERWKDESEMVKELGKRVYVSGQQFSRLAVEISRLYGGEVSWSKEK
uniref:ARAD1B24420p n=1 Tax=Blastobotrys adeninivorans TaxID=409370 RepID=A0A060T726_BLAAD